MSKMNLEEGFYFVLGLVGLIFLKCASLHYTMKLWRWLRGAVSSKEAKATEPVKKCHDIFEYNFLDEYESQNEGDDSDTLTVNSASNTGRNFPDTPHNGIDNNCWKGTESGSGPGSGSGTGTGIEVATKNLLGLIRSRRERTAKDLMDTNIPLTASSGGTASTGSKNNRDEFSFSTSATKSTNSNSNSYLAYLGEVLKDCPRPSPTRWSTTKPKSPQQQQQQQQEDNANSKKFK